MTTVAYCSVSADGRTFAEQMFMRPEVIAPLRRVTDAVHREGGAASLQLGHCGWFTKNAGALDPAAARPLAHVQRLRALGGKAPRARR